MRVQTQQYTSEEQIINNLIRLKNLCLEVTDACNLACDYCVYRDLYGDHDERHGKMMNFQQARGIIDYLAEYWASCESGRIEDITTISFYGGEPLLNINLIKEVLRYLKELKIRRRFKYNMTTNAMLLKNNLDFLVDNDFSLLISLDGDIKGNGHRRKHDGNSSFSQVFENLKYAKQEYPDYFSKKVRFNVVLNNLNDIETSMNFIHNEFGTYPNISEINPRGLTIEGLKRFKEMYKGIEESLSVANNIPLIQNIMGIRFPETARLIQYLRNKSGNYYEGYLSLIANLARGEYRPSPGTCSPFAKKMFVTVNGRILQCERIGQNFSLGEIDENGVRLDPQMVAEEFNSRIDRMRTVCLSCGRVCSCKKCFYYLEDADTDQPSCSDFDSVDSINEKSVRHYLSRNPQIIQQIKEEYIIQ